MVLSHRMRGAVAQAPQRHCARPASATAHGSWLMAGVMRSTAGPSPPLPLTEGEASNLSVSSQNAWSDMKGKIFTELFAGHWDRNDKGFCPLVFQYGVQ